MAAVEERLEIVNELGMHARAATKFVQTANRFSSEIAVEKDGQKVNGKSIMGVLLLAAPQGSGIRLHIDGRDEEEALAALEALVADRFGEGC